MARSRLGEQLRTPAADRPRLGPRAEVITLLFGLWILAGMLGDFTAHRSGVQEPLFTPSHIVLFSAYFAFAVWLLRAVLAQMRSGRRGLDAVPVGYDLALVAVVLGVVVIVADSLWHRLFGFEVGLKVFLSPSHIVAFVALMLLFASPFRAAWAADPDPDGYAPSLKAFLPTVLSITLTTLFLALAFTYVWPFFGDQRWYDAQLSRIFGETLQAGGLPAAALREVLMRRFIGGILLGNLILFAPLLLMLRRWRLPFGTATIYMVGVSEPWYTSFAVVAGLVTDGLIWLLRPSPRRLGALRLFATVTPLVVWSLYFLRVHMLWGIPLPPEGWTGSIVWSAIGGLALSAIMIPGGFAADPRAAPQERNPADVREHALRT